MGSGGRSPTLPASTRASRLREAASHTTRPAGGARTNDLYSNPFARTNLRGPGGGRGGDFARPYEKRGPPGNDQRYFAKPSNKPYSPQVPPATLALLVSLQGAPWRTASDFRRQLVRAGHAPVPPVAACVEIKFTARSFAASTSTPSTRRLLDGVISTQVTAIDGALRKHAADYGIASRVDADGRRRFTVVDKVRAARTAAARRREAREAPCTSHAAAVAEASHARVEAAARSDALFERLSRRLAAAGVHLSGSSSPSNPAWCDPPPQRPPIFKVAVPLSRGASDASSAWETVEPTPKPRNARDASASKRVPRTVREEDSWEASPQYPGDRHRRRRSVSQAVTQARWASPQSAESDLTDSPSAAWSGTHMRED